MPSALSKFKSCSLMKKGKEEGTPKSLEACAESAPNEAKEPPKEEVKENTMAEAKKDEQKKEESKPSEAQKEEPKKEEPKTDSKDGKEVTVPYGPETVDTKEQAPEHKKPERQWYMTGEQALGAAEREYEQNRRKPFRFWLSGGDSGNIIFVDDAGFAFWEHEMKVSGYWMQVTCLRGVDQRGCPLCQHFGRAHRYLVTLRTIIDLRPFDTKDGERREWSRKILATKDRTNKAVERRRKSRGTLVGSQYLVSRNDQKSARCGDDFEFVKEVDLSQYKYEDQQSKKMIQVEPFDYGRIYAPAEFGVAKELIVEAEVVDEEAGDQDREVPF